jgi:hypothetical protein
MPQLLAFCLKSKLKPTVLPARARLRLSNSDLSKLGINRNALGDTGSELIVAPNAQFKGKLNVAGSTTLSGQLSLNDKVSGTNASFTQLQAGKTSVSELDVNGDSTASTL